MPLRLDIKRQLSTRSERVKNVDLHPTEPWMLSALYNGTVQVWSTDTQEFVVTIELIHFSQTHPNHMKTLLKTFEVTDLPVRAARFILRKSWVVTGSDDMNIRVFNYNTLEKVHTFEAHNDYIRSIAVHPTQPLLVSSSDDMLIKLWNWEQSWANTQVFEGHTHYVMSVMFNPKDTNTFASASLDRTIKVWQIGSKEPNFTLVGHESGVNTIDYFQGGEKPYLISGADDRLVKIWDYQNKSCVQTLEGHSANVSAVCFHPELPIILTGSEDGTVRIWHSSTYRMENTLNYGLERVWSMAYFKGSNDIAIGYDEGTIMIKLGREEPAISMDNSGKLIWARHSEVQTANLAKLDQDSKDGEVIPLPSKAFGACEIYPQTLVHNPNGRFVVVCGDGEYIIHTALNFRNKSYGQALDFVWAPSGEYAIRETSSKIRIFKNFKERSQVKIDFSAEALYGGTLLGVRGASSLTFFDWDTCDAIRRIDIDCIKVLWSPNGDRVSICTDEAFYVLKYDEAAKQAAFAGGEIDEEGVEEAFDVESEIEEEAKTGLWVGDCFIYTNVSNRLNYYVGGEIVTVAHLDRPMYLVGYLESSSRLFLCDKDATIVSYELLRAVLLYQTAVMRGDLEAADSVLPDIPPDQRNRVAHFLENQGFKEQALVVTGDKEHKFQLALTLHRLDIARDMAVEIDDQLKWKQLGDHAMRQCNFDLAEECLERANDLSGLLLLATSAGKKDKMNVLVEKASEESRSNIAFVALLLQGKLAECVQLLVQTERYAEAALFCRSYCPSHLDDVVVAWKEDLSKTQPKAAAAIAEPNEFGNLFPEIESSKATEAAINTAASTNSSRPAVEYSEAKAERAVPIAQRFASSTGNDGGDAATTQPTPEETLESSAPDDAVDEGELDDLDAELDAELDEMEDAVGDGDDDFGELDD